MAARRARLAGAPGHAEPARRRTRAGLAGRLRREGQRLLHQQCWCFGRDIHHPDGNLLLAYGLVRTRRLGDGPPLSAYHLDTDARRVSLWGFGIWSATPDDDGVFLGRYAFRPRIGPFALARHEVFRATELAGTRWVRRGEESARAARAIAQLAEWVAAYEQWVEATAGRAWRAEVLTRWDGVIAEAGATAAAWTRLAQASGAARRTVAP